LILAGKVKALADGRFNVSLDDIRDAAPSALRHRLIRNFEAEAEGITTDHVINCIVADLSPDATVSPALEQDANSIEVRPSS